MTWSESGAGGLGDSAASPRPARPSEPLTPADPLWSERDGAPAPSDATAEEPTDPTEVLAAAVLAVPGVRDLHGGALGEIATYLPRRRVRGVRLHPDGAELHVVIDMSAPIATTVETIRSVAGPLVDGRIDVVVEDVAG